MLLRSPRNVPPHNGERSEELRGALRDDPNNAGCEVDFKCLKQASLPRRRSLGFVTRSWQERVTNP